MYKIIIYKELGKQYQATDFLTDPRNVISVDDVTLLHDKAPGWLANAMQQLLRERLIDFSSKSEYPCNSADCNVTETVVTVLKSRVEEKMMGKRGSNHYGRRTLLTHTNSVLSEMEYETNIFESLLLTYPDILADIRKHNGGHTKF